MSVEIQAWLERNYYQKNPPVYVQGWVVQDSSVFTEYLSSRVYSKLIDSEGQKIIRELLQDIATTGFLKERLESIFMKNPDLEPWKIGEALAECFLEDQFGLLFPWNTNRDARVAKASLPGADLVGFITVNNGVRFVFGEVKTSWDGNIPPAVVYGRSGMTFQLEKLRDDSNSREQLFKWLAYRAVGASWQSCFQEAAKAYLYNDKDVCLYGVLVRDTFPALKDLESRGRQLGTGCPAEMTVYLSAYYLSVPIQEWPEIIKATGLR